MNCKLIIIVSILLLISSLTLCHGLGEIEKLKEPVKLIADYEKVTSKTDTSLTDSVFVSNDAFTMDIKFIDGNLKLTDVMVHNTRDIALLESTLIKELKGYNGHSVQVFHINDAGIYDYIEIYELVKADGYVYLFDIEFSEIIIDGYVGVWEVTSYNLSVSDSLNFGQTFNASNVTSLSVNVMDNAIKSHPYDINTTGLVGWWKLDDDYLDSSGNGNNGTASGNTSFVNSKYNNGTWFNYGSNITVPNFDDSDGSISVIAYVNMSSGGDIRKTIQTAYPVCFFEFYGNKLNVYLQGTSNPGWHSSTNSIQLNISTQTGFVYNGNNLTFYINGEIDNVVENINGTVSDSNLLIFGNFYLSGRSFVGSLDNMLRYNRALSSTEFKLNYLDTLQQLKIKTNSNSTWSSEWNSTADNPIQVPYADGEFFSLSNFTVPDTVVQNGITIYDYPSTVQFDAVATVGYTEYIKKITEEATASTYTLNVTHAANNTGEGYINYTTTNSVLLDADFWNAAVLTTDNPNASLSTTLPHFNISTGYVAAATEYYYLVEQDYFYPPQNVQTTPSQTWVNITWDAVPNADNYSVYELEDGFPYVTTNPVIDGVKDAIYNYSHEFLIFSPNPVNPGDYETIYPLRTSLGAYFLIESVDNDNKLGDDDAIYYFDLDNDGLTVNDPAWKITNNIVKKYLWDGASWKVTGVSSAVGASTGGGTLYPIHELFIPIIELGANWTNGSTVKVLVKRVDSSLTPDVVRWYPYGNINDTNTSLWQEMVLNEPESYTFLNNTTNLWYNATGLTPFTIYHGAVSIWNGSQESSYTLFDVITDDIPYYSVSGYIKNQDGNPLPDITVHSCNGFVHEITTTNESGFWIGYAFRADNYTICANHTCYISDSIDIHVTDNMTNQNITLDNVIVNNCELMEKLLEIEDIVTPNSTVPTPSQPQNAMPLPLFIAWTLILIGLVYVAYPKRDDDDDMDIGIKNITASFISVILAFTLGKISINGQLVQTFSGMSEINTVVIDTSVIQIGWLGSLFTFIGITMVILTILLLVSEYKDRYGDVEDE